MKVPALRTFTRPFLDLNDHKSYVKRMEEHYRPKHLLRDMVANPDFKGFKALNQRAAGGDVRFHFVFPQDIPDKIILDMADRKNPTLDDMVTAFKNIFKPKSKKQPLPTMTAKELRGFIKDSIKGVFFPAEVGNYPVKSVTFDPKKPYIEEMKTALRELANERLFGAK